MNEGNTLTMLAKLGEKPRENLQAAFELFDQARAMIEVNTPFFASSLADEASARRALADLGVDAQENLVIAIELAERARVIWGPGRVEFARSLINEGASRHALAKRGMEERDNLEAALRLFQRARPNLSSGSPDLVTCLENEVTVRERLAGLGVDPLENLATALGLCEQTLATSEPGTRAYASHLQGEALVKTRLAGLGINSRENLEEALRLHLQARAIFPQGSSDWAECLVNEALARMRLAERGVEPRANLLEALRLCHRACATFAHGNANLANAMLNEVSVRGRLADFGIDPIENLGESLKRLEEVQAILEARSPDLALSLVQRGNVGWRLAKLGVRTRDSLEEAAESFGRARELMGPENPDLALCLIGLANVVSALGKMGVKPRENLEEAVSLYEQSRLRFAPDSVDYAVALMNEGMTRIELSNQGVDVAANLDNATKKLAAAGETFIAANAYLYAGNCFHTLGHYALRMGDRHGAKGAFRKAIGALEQVRSSHRILRQRQSWIDDNIGLFRVMTEVCLDLGDDAEALEYAESGRTRVLLDMMATEDFTPRNADAATIDEYRRLRRRVEELEVLDEGPTAAEGERAADARRVEKDEALERLSAIEDHIRELDPDFFTLARPLDRTQMAALVTRLGRPLVVLWVGENYGTAFVLTAGGGLETIPLPGVSDEVVGRWMFGTPDCQGSPGWLGTYLRFREGLVGKRSWIAQIERTLAEVHGLLMEQVRGWLAARGYRHAAIVATGALGLLPLHATSWRDVRGEHHLLDDVELVFSPSVWVLARCLDRCRGPWCPVLQVSPPGEPAPFIRWAAERVRVLVQAERGPGSVLTLAAGATPETVTERLRTAPVAHFACHGEWDAAEPLNSALHLAGVRLSLADLFARARTEEARLTLLTACESAAGHRPVVGGGEYLGLPAAFILAGSKAVIGSLWRVDDAATAFLTVELCRRLVGGTGSAEALRAAQIWLRKIRRAELLELAEEPLTAELLGPLEWNYLNTLPDLPFVSPYYWAAFQAVGSPEPLTGD